MEKEKTQLILRAVAEEKTQTPANLHTGAQLTWKA